MHRFFFACLVILASCSSSPKISSDFDQKTDFSQYRTFAFFDPLGTDAAGYESLVSQTLKEATRFVTLQVALAITSTALIGAAVDWLRMPETMVWVGVMGAITLCNYAASKLWVFAKPKDQRK